VKRLHIADITFILQGVLLYSSGIRILNKAALITLSWGLFAPFEKLDNLSVFTVGIL
jgi:hypothetical protein